MDVVSLQWLSLGIIFIMSCVYWYYRYVYSFWEKKGIKFVEPVIPFGNSKDMIFLRKSLAEIYQGFYKAFPEEAYVGMYEFTNPKLIIRDPDLIKHVLVKDFAHFQDRGITMDEKLEPLGAHLFFLKGSKWKNLRAKLTPTFTSGKIKMMFNLMNECAEQLKHFLEKPATNEEMMEMKEVMAKFTTDVIGTCAFGLQFNAIENEDSEFRKMGRKIFTPSTKIFLVRLMRNVCPSILSLLKIKGMPQDINDFFIGAVKETVEYREKNNYVRNDFIQLLIQLKNKENIQHEDDILSTEDRRSSLNHEEINRKEKDIETLRKHPPASFLIRQVTKPYVVPGTSLELHVGQGIVIPVYALHRDPKYFPEPERFNPENFSNEAKASRPHYSYLPFGEGPRICIGMRFGLLQTKLGLATLLLNYEFSICEKTEIPLKLDPKQTITSSTTGAWLRIKKNKS